jgi:hypothetical protein
MCSPKPRPDGDRRPASPAPAGVHPIQREFISLVSPAQSSARRSTADSRARATSCAPKFKGPDIEIAADAITLLNLQEQAIATLKDQVDPGAAC